MGPTVQSACELVRVCIISWMYVIMLMLSTVKHLTLNTPGKIFSRRHSDNFFLFYSENRIRHFMQIVSDGDNLHKTSNPVFLENWEKIQCMTNLSSAENFTHACLVIMKTTNARQNPWMCMCVCISQFTKEKYNIIFPQRTLFDGDNIMTLDKRISRPWGYKTFSCSTQLSMKFVLGANKSQNTNNCKVFLTKHSWAWNFLC